VAAAARALSLNGGLRCSDFRHHEDSEKCNYLEIHPLLSQTVKASCRTYAVSFKADDVP
jgi:hypothetical protein